ncbi:MAG: 4-(cytidine 5'-diphospho)-2-C-methyl-D-erythritol kinase [Nitrospirae bacterium]|nr:4-(cytidine 5'-diphospho)-2-C-methyl-D-erythritol kinase [Nitrospirota bacterium]
MPRRFRVLAPAKINLNLRILGPRPDDFHEIATVMQKVSLADEIGIRITSGRGIRLICDNPELPTDRGNLAVRAAGALLKNVDTCLGLHLTLRKRIPAGAGLGGGSSDAAQVLLALNQVLRLDLGASALLEIGAGLGSDVPFFLTPHTTALAAGRGEKIAPFPAPEAAAYVLAYPGFSVSTAAVYDEYRRGHRGSRMKRVSPADWARAARAGSFWRRHGRNDLEPVVVHRHAEIGRMEKALLGAGAIHAAMSGSGPAVFGVFESARDARRALTLLRGEPRWSAWVVTPH